MIDSETMFVAAMTPVFIGGKVEEKVRKHKRAIAIVAATAVTVGSLASVAHRFSSAYQPTTDSSQND